MTILKRITPDVLPNHLRDVITFLGRATDLDSTPVYIVGGTLRDLLLGRSIDDVDLAVEGSVASVVSQLRNFFQTPDLIIEVNPVLDTAHVECNDVQFDLAATRAESYAQRSAYPQGIASVGIQWDLFRRDFTVNALAARVRLRDGLPDIGTIVDEVGGLADLEAGIMRVLHDDSFRDDPTRLLRLIRFTYRLGFQVDTHTAQLAKQAVLDRVYTRIAPVQAKREVALYLNEVPVDKRQYIVEMILGKESTTFLEWASGLDLEAE